MVFSSPIFLFVFLPIVLIGYFLLQFLLKEKAAVPGNIWLFLTSLIFYAWNRPEFTFILIAGMLINYTGARILDGMEKTGIRKFCLIVTVSLNLLMLFYFKYFNYTILILNKYFLGRAGVQLDFKEVFLPIGISFFTFQGLSYVVDVYRKDVPAQKKLYKLGMYISMFPQLVAGPIVRYKDIANQVDRRHVTTDDFVEGIRRFVIGLSKKILLADGMAYVADQIFGNQAQYLSIPSMWVGAFFYTMQIYFDFSGYSDMAIGMGRMFGFHFMENFNYPYIAGSITEFWKRWHISLTSFFRDYVYIPLGGNRKHHIRNIAIVFLLTGIWHGASLNFVFWGVFHGFFRIMEKILEKPCAPLIKKIPKPLFEVLRHIYTFAVVLIGWVFFRIGGLRNSANWIMTMFGMRKPLSAVKAGWYLDAYSITIFILCVIGCTPVVKNLCGKFLEKLPEKACIAVQYLGILVLLFICIMKVATGSYSAFIYFQF